MFVNNKNRRGNILELLDSKQTVSISDLVERFEVSEMTIRRDLKALEEKGLLHRIHGGAIKIGGRSYSPPYLIRKSKNVPIVRLINPRSMT